MDKFLSQFSSVHFSHLVVSDSLQPHELQHARPPCPSPTPRVHSDSRPSSQWCHPAISSSVVPFSSWPQSLPVRSHHGRSHSWQRSCGRDLTGKGRSGLEGPPESAQASTPKPESVCLTILCLLPTLLTLTGGYPQPPFFGKNQLRALVNKSLGHERNISILSPLLAF